MPRRANQLKSNTFRTGKNNTKRKSKTSSYSMKSIFSFFRDERIRRVFGFFLILLSVYLLFAFVSFTFSWWIDQDKVNVVNWSQFGKRMGIENWTGYAGAYISKLIIHDGFGISSFLILLIIFVWGFKLLFKRQLLSINKTFWHSLILILWLSVAFGLLFKDSTYAALGGVFGYQINLILIKMIGLPGVFIALLFILVSYLIVFFNFPFKLFTISASKKEIISETPKNEIKDDKYNTVEFSVSEDEDFEIDLKEDEKEEIEFDPIIT